MSKFYDVLFSLIREGDKKELCQFLGDAFTFISLPAREALIMIDEKNEVTYSRQLSPSINMALYDLEKAGLLSSSLENRNEAYVRVWKPTPILRSFRDLVKSKEKPSEVTS